MNRSKVCIATLLTMALGCALFDQKSPPQSLKSPENGLIGVKVSVCPPVWVGSTPQDTVAFVKIEKTEDMYTGRNWYQSSYNDRNQLYLLNAEPGEYVIVASMWKDHQAQKKKDPDYDDLFFRRPLNITYFKKAVIPQTLVRVKPGEAVFMGDFLIKHRAGWGESDLVGGDSVQTHYEALLDSEKYGLWSRSSYSGTLKESCKDHTTAKDFFTKALRTFQGTDWQPMIEAKLKKLGGSYPSGQ